jgi:hypothetical protein
MTSLSQTALEFCRECLGWDSQLESFPNGYHRVKTEGRDDFNYTDLDGITAKIHRWCKENHCQWAVFGNDRHGNFEYLAIVLPFDDLWEARCENAPSPHQALLAACVEAARSMKQQEQLVTGSDTGRKPV